MVVLSFSSGCKLSVSSPSKVISLSLRLIFFVLNVYIPVRVYNLFSLKLIDNGNLQQASADLRGKY